MNLKDYKCDQHIISMAHNESAGSGRRRSVGRQNTVEDQALNMIHREVSQQIPILKKINILVI